MKWEQEASWDSYSNEGQTWQGPEPLCLGVERRERETKEVKPGSRLTGGGARKSMAFRFLVCGIVNRGTAVENSSNLDPMWPPSKDNEKQGGG